MTEADFLAELRVAEALLEGHFLLSSGRHSTHYLQCARLLMDGKRAERVARALADKLRESYEQTMRAVLNVDYVISPAMGGLIIGHEIGRALGKPALFLERKASGSKGGGFELRRGFAIERGAKVLLVEDVVTTGLSSNEAIAAVREVGGDPIAEAALIDRRSSAGEEVRLDVPHFCALLALDFPTYAADALPADLAAIPAVKPGSRGATQG